MIKPETITKTLDFLNEAKKKITENNLSFQPKLLSELSHVSNAKYYYARNLGYFSSINYPDGKRFYCHIDKFEPYHARKVIEAENKKRKHKSIERIPLPKSHLIFDRPNKTDIKDNFIPPLLSDVEKYCNEKGFGIYPPDFITYYNNKGWTVGTSGGKRTPMKDWKKAIHNWMRNDKKYAVKKSSELSDQEIRDEWEKRGLSERKELSDFPFPEIFDYVKKCGWTGKMNQEIQF